MRKKDDSIRETLLDCARELAQTQGYDAINIRAIAKMAGVATGTVYNYFANKDDILLELTDEYWRKTLEDMKASIIPSPFPEQLKACYQFLYSHIDDAGMLMNSLHNVESIGRMRMQKMLQVLQSEILQYILQDTSIRSNLWNESFTQQKYTEFIVMNMLALMQMKEPNPDFFIEIIKRTLY